MEALESFRKEAIHDFDRKTSLTGTENEETRSKSLFGRLV
jgi:hypothetical protein